MSMNSFLETICKRICYKVRRKLPFSYNFFRVEERKFLEKMGSANAIFSPLISKNFEKKKLFRTCHPMIRLCTLKAND